MAGEADLKAQIVIEAQDQASAVIKNLAGGLSQLGGAFGQIASMAGPVGIAIGAVATGLLAVVNTGQGVADQVEQLDLLSKRTGVAVEDLQVLTRQIEQMGGQSESLTQALSFLNRSIATGDPLLAQLGVTSKDTFTAFQQLSVAFSQSDDTAKKTEIGFRLLGRGAGDLVALMPQLAAGFDQSKASMSAAGGVLTGEVLEAARRLDEQSDQLKAKWADMMTKIKGSTVETALAVVTALNDMWDAMTGREKSPDEVEREIGKVTQSIADLGKAATAARMTGFGAVAAPIEAEIAKLGERLETLKQQRAEFDAVIQAPVATAAQQQGVENAVLEPKKKTEKSAREEQIERIMSAMQRTRPEAEALVKQLDEISDLKFADSIREQLGFLNEIPIENLAAVSEEVAHMAELFDTSEDEAAGMVARLKELGDERQRQTILNQLQGEQAFTVDDALQKWTEAVVEMQDLANVVDETFGNLFQGLEQGFNTVFQNLLTEGQTFASAMQTLFRSMVSALLAELAKLAAVAVFKQILGFFTGGGANAIPIPNLASRLTTGEGPSLPAPEPTFAVMPPIELPPVEIVSPPPLQLPQQSFVAPPPLELPTPTFLQPRPELAFERAPQPIAEPVNVSVKPPVAEPIPVEVAPPGNTFNVYTYDAHTIVADLVSPGGKLRRAQDTVAVLGAY